MFDLGPNRNQEPSMQRPATISEKLAEAITALLCEKPELCEETDPRGSAGSWLAINNPEAFDRENPADMLIPSEGIKKVRSDFSLCSPLTPKQAYGVSV